MRRKNLLGMLLIMSGTMIIGCNDNNNDCPVGPAPVDPVTPAFGVYYPGDFHQHTTYSDGGASIGYVMQRNYDFGLSWWANSEHGGSFDIDGAQSGYDVKASVKWTPGQIINNPTPAGQSMWRWQSIEQYSFAEVLKARAKFSNKIIVQGLEWNVPGHEHASTAIIGDEFTTRPNALAVAEFEYRFDDNDTDMIGKNGWIKSTKTGHEKTLEALKWLQDHHAKTSWVVPAHPERKNLYHVNHFRDMNNVAPDVCFGFESIPGHQCSAPRGGIGASASYGKTGTFGGVGVMAAEVGGLWDALLSEGRHWWLFANSDFHNGASTVGGGDFYPGEYQKTYVSFAKNFVPGDLADGLRGGNSFCVHGDLINDLRFSIGDATMGQTYNAQDQSVTLTIVVRDPEGLNNNVYSAYNAPVLQHVDVIMGEVSGKISPSDAKYTDGKAPRTRVIARFDATGGKSDKNGLASIAWQDLGGGYKKMTFTVSGVTSDRYFRLRGTNHPLESPKLDGAGNPVADELSGNTAAKAFEDLWFYSNPVFVKAKK